MGKNAELFINKTLGEDFSKSLEEVLSKSEVYKQGTRTITDTDDLFQGLQIVPKALLGLLVRELSPMQIGDTKEIRIPGKDDTIVRTTKHERDSYSGQILQNNVKISDFMHRSVPGLGLVLMTMLELYDFENPSVGPKMDSSMESQISKIIDERLNLHSLINQVIDGKLMHRDAVQQMIMAKLTQMTEEHKEIKEEQKEEPKAVVIVVSKKKSPLSDFVENRKRKLAKKEFSIEMTKSETVNCPDCNQTIFNDSGISACMCFGSDMGNKVYLKKTEDGIKVSFPKSWSEENIEMLLEVLRSKNG